MIDVVMKKGGSSNILGRVGENEHRRMLFDITDYLAMYPDANFVLFNVLPDSSIGYPVANTTKDDQYFYWTTTSSDLSKEGNGSCELLIYDGDVIAKSDIYKTRILESIDGSGDAPDPWEGIYEEFVEVKNQTEAAAEAVQNMNATASTVTSDTPASVEKIIDPDTGVVTLSFSIPRGIQGEQGIQGERGYTGNTGATGGTFTPSVSDAGVVSWTNDRGLPNPAPVDVAGAVRGIVDINVSGTIPMINAESNHRYICGEVVLISFTPSSSGICDLIFRSGNTPAMLSIPSSIKWPDWFEPSSLDSNTIYEINVVDGVYGAVMTWSV